MSKLRKKLTTIGVFAVGGAMLRIAVKGVVWIDWLSNVIGVTGLLIAFGATFYFKGLFPGIDKRYYDNPNNKEWE